jgi:hypothetical protein
VVVAALDSRLLKDGAQVIVLYRGGMTRIVAALSGLR